MPRGDKGKYTDKQKRQAEHIEEGYEDKGVSKKEAESRAWATVNKESGGGKKSGSGRGKKAGKKKAAKKSAEEKQQEVISESREITCQKQKSERAPQLARSLQRKAARKRRAVRNEISGRAAHKSAKLARLPTREG